MLFTIARWRRRITRCGITARGRRIPGRRIRRRLGFSGWRRRGSSRPAAIADQLAVVVTDIPDAMRHIEGRQPIPASIGSAADRGQGTTLHSEIPAALLIGSRRQPLCICRKGQPRQRHRPEQPGYYLHLQLHPVDEPDNGRGQPEISGRVVLLKRANVCGGGNVSRPGNSSGRSPRARGKIP